MGNARGLSAGFLGDDRGHRSSMIETATFVALAAGAVVLMVASLTLDRPTEQTTLDGEIVPIRVVAEGVDRA